MNNTFEEVKTYNKEGKLIKVEHIQYEDALHHQDREYRQYEKELNAYGTIGTYERFFLREYA